MTASLEVRSSLQLPSRFVRRHRKPCPSELASVNARGRRGDCSTLGSILQRSGVSPCVAPAHIVALQGKIRVGGRGRLPNGAAEYHKAAQRDQERPAEGQAGAKVGEDYASRCVCYVFTLAFFLCLFLRGTSFHRLSERRSIHTEELFPRVSFSLKGGCRVCPSGFFCPQRHFVAPCAIPIHLSTQ